MIPLVSYSSNVNALCKTTMYFDQLSFASGRPTESNYLPYRYACAVT